MPATVYVESSVPSYLAARPSRDLVVAAHQQVTHEWWRTAEKRFELLVSEVVLDEIQAGDADAASVRVKLVQGLRVLQFSDEVRSAARLYRRSLGLPARASNDLLHLAFAVAYGVDYLVTWNCAHIANGEVIRRLSETNRIAGYTTPIIVTPDQLLEKSEDRDVE